MEIQLIEYKKLTKMQERILDKWRNKEKEKVAERQKYLELVNE